MNANGREVGRGMKQLFTSVFPPIASPALAAFPVSCDSRVSRVTSYSIEKVTETTAMTFFSSEDVSFSP